MSNEKTFTWTTKESNYIRRYAKHTIAEIAQGLGRSYRSVLERSRSMGLELIKSKEINHRLPRFSHIEKKIKKDYPRKAVVINAKTTLLIRADLSESEEKRIVELYKKISL